MQAIITKIIQATYTKPTRIKASCSRGSIVVTEDSSTVDAHRKVARALCQKFCIEDLKRSGAPVNYNVWSDNFITGQLPNMDYVHVFQK